MDEQQEKQIRKYMAGKIQTHFIKYQKKWSGFVTLGGYDYFETADSPEAAKEAVLKRIMAIKNIETMYQNMIK